MAMVEGHAEHVMDAVGLDELPSLERLRARLDQRRRERPPIVRLIEWLLGLELKLRQYDVGRRFCDAVVAAAGIDGLNRAWHAPELLPSPAELADPRSWLARTRSAA
jgi:putative hydrolase